MKVRWTCDSVRLRISPTELATLERGDPVNEELVFPGGHRWRIQIQPGVDTGLESDARMVFFALSQPDLTLLADPDAEGVYFQHDDPQHPIRYLIEKDFPCVHPRSADAREPESETFAAPEGFAGRKS